MKKISALFLLAFAFKISYSQNSHSGTHPVNENSENAKWNVYGNDIDVSDIFGTTNNYPINFYTNNIQRMVLGTDGVLKINNLAGIGNRILTVDANGNLTVLPGNVSTAISSWNSNGSNIYLSSGNLGIGTNNPIAKLDVNGDARISNNLYVGGGIVISDKVQAATEITSLDMKLSNDLTVQGTSKFSGPVTTSQGIMFDNSNGFRYSPSSPTAPPVFSLGEIGGPPLTINPCIIATPDPWFNFGGRIQLFNGASNTALTMGSDGVSSTIEHSGSNGLLINYYCGKNIYLGTGTGTGTGGLGTAGAKVYTGDFLYARKNVQIGVNYQAIDPNVSLNVFLDGTTEGIKLWPGGNPNYKLIHDNYEQFMIMGDGRTSIGVNNTVGAAPYKKLTVNGDVSLANYYSGTGNGADGYNGLEILGNNQVPTRRGIATDADPNGNLNFYINSNEFPDAFNFKDGNGNKTLAIIDASGKLTLNSQNASGDALAIVDASSTSNKTNFRVMNNGRTEIHIQNPVVTGKALYIVDDLNNKDIFLVKSDGKVYAREVEISLATAFPDYVFNKDYKLKPISEVESYIKNNRHLPGFEKGEFYEKNGINVNTMIVNQQEKIEELTLYIIELEKRIKKLEILSK